MSNEELAALIQAGEHDRLPELWEQTHRFIRQKARRVFYALDGRGGVTAEDLQQAGFLALLAAVESYDTAEDMSFIGWLALYLKTAFAEAAGYRTRKQWADPIQQAGSLDAPLGDDMEDLTLADAIPDPAAVAELEAVIERDRRQRLHEALEDALEAMPEAERSVLRARYYQGRTMEEIGAERGMDWKQVIQIENRAIRRLRQPRTAWMLRQHL